MQNNLVHSTDTVCSNAAWEKQSRVLPLPISILEEIVCHKRQEVAQRQKYRPLEHLKLSAAYAQPPVDFLAALCESSNPISLIAEVKKASPSKGTICENFDPVAIAQAYEQGGATCLSVLTDQKFFQGSFDYLSQIRRHVSLPLLCKEFVISAYQVYLARASGADAVLLIAAILNDQELQTFLDLIHDLGMTALVEVHTLVELDRVLSLKNLRLIGINNRNLADFTIDLKTTQCLIQQRQEQIFKLGITVVSESGLHTSTDLESVAKAGARAVLVGESLVKQTDIKQAVVNLLGESISISSPNAKSTLPLTSLNKYQPDSSGRFGRFGGRYIPETLILPLRELETAYLQYRDDKEFQHELNSLLRDYAGRPTPLYFAKRLTAHYARLDGTGPQIFLKREDLNHTGSHKINSALAQVLLAKRVGKQRIVTETGDGQHGVATASACARLNMPCTIYMGTHDLDQHPFNVTRMQLMGADLQSVDGGHGRLKDAISDAIRECFSHLDSTYYLPGSAIGPHPYPMMVRDFQAIIGRETRGQCQEQWEGKPDILLACIGGGSNAIGLFYEFLQDSTVRLIGVEAAGKGISSGKHAATLTQGKLGVFHGSMSYLLQVEDGQTLETSSICSGLNYPSVGPEHSYLKEIERVEYHSVTDQQAIDAFLRLSKLEGIIPALETAHAIAYLETLCSQVSGSPRIIINCSGRGDKDVQMVAEISRMLT